MGKEVECLLPERLREGHVSRFSAFAANPQVRPMAEELRLFARRKDGTEFGVEIRLSPVQTDKQLLISSAIRDVTSSK